ncbi:MAG: DNA mismatch repair endonuclease MutL [Alphaproteobacteria bacterium]
MGQIKELSDNIINKIAAGEVLERPASAVKELVENSLDANAKVIDIIVRDGGKTEISVSDDGIGIQEEDLKKAVSRHATSKLNENNFDRIKTLGFRGEALSSIVSVAEVTLRTSAKDNSEGYEMKIISGEEKYCKPIKKKRGCLVRVNNLFFSTPARLKFLKSENYESLLIKRLVQKFSLIFFDVQFNLRINNKQLISTVPSNDKNWKDRFFRRVDNLLGSEFLENSVELSEEKNNVKIFGLIGLPTFNYSNSNNQFIFVNNRIINDKALNSIMRVAYKDFMFHDRFPQLILNIQCPHEHLDINVHPMKNEVRFENFSFLKSFIISSIRLKLQFITDKPSVINSPRSLNRNNTGDYQTKLSLKEENTYDFESVEQKKDYIYQNYDIESYPLGHARSQFHNNYIISQTNEGIVIVDQHAAHERIVYEELKDNYYNKKINTQILLIPIIINLEKLDLDVIENKLILLERYGLKIEFFGSTSVIVREVPAIIANCDIKLLVEKLIQEIVDDQHFDSLEVQVNKICSTLACYGSIRSGRELQVEEMNNLLRKMEQTKYSAQCNHGRPTFIKLDLNEIEKMFKRK